MRGGGCVNHFPSFSALTTVIPNRNGCVCIHLKMFFTDLLLPIQHGVHPHSLIFYFFLSFFGFFFFFFFRTTPAAYRSSQSRGPIGAVAAGLLFSFLKKISDCWEVPDGLAVKDSALSLL